MKSNIDFDLDDPLGDLLSDKSDDSFFEEKHKTSNKISRNSSLDVKKSSLFGLDDDIPKPEVVPPSSTSAVDTSKGDWLGIKDSPFVKKKLSIEKSFPVSETSPKHSKAPLQASIKPKSNFSGDNLTFLDDFGLSDDAETKIPPVKNSTTFMEDILGPSKPSAISRISTPLKNEQTQQTSGYNPTSGTSKIAIGKISAPTLKTNSDKNQLESKQKPIQIKPVETATRESSGRRRRSTDWLGLFSDEEPVEEPLTEKNVPLAELLKSQDEKLVVKQNEENKSGDPRRTMASDRAANITMNNLLGGDLTLGVGPSVPMMSNADIEQQSAAICLQQQQAQLMVALQLKAQEESLAALHERQEESRRVQQEVVTAHRDQLEQLLKGQVEHRTHLHEVMMQHQQRINQHIKALLRPSTLWQGKKEEDTKTVPNELDVKTNVVRDSADDQEVVKTMSEREQLENMIVNLKENHSKELDILENSYRHQVHLMNESLTNVEERLKAENENLTNYYLKRIEKLEQENIRSIEQAEDRMRSLQEKMATEREEIEKKHKRDLEILQEQNYIVISNIKDTIALERSTLKDSTDYSSKMEIILKDIEKNNTVCNSYMNKMDSRHEQDIADKENALAIKERQVTVLLESIEVSRGTLEKETQAIRANLRNWEERLHSQSKAIEEDKLMVKVAKMDLQNEREIFASEKDKLRLLIDNERDAMKRNVEAVQEKNKDMEKVLVDKMNRLDQDRLQSEIQQKNIEDIRRKQQEIRSKLENELSEVKERKNNVENSQEKLYKSETALAARFQELETLTRSALTKHSVAEHRISEADYVQQKYEEKIKELQEFALSLSSREQQVARDKVSLSRERIMFHNMQREYQCSLCKGSKVNPMVDISKYATTQSVLRNYKATQDIMERFGSRDTTEDEKIMRKDIVKRSNLHFNNITESDKIPNTLHFVSKAMNNNEDKMYASLDLLKLYEKPAPLFKEIVDPRLVQLKLDIQSTIANNTKTDQSDQE